MSASAVLQQLITARLANSATAALGNGVATVLPFAHGLAAPNGLAVALTMTAGGAPLVRGTDYTIDAADDDTLAITALHGAPAAGAWTARAALVRGSVPFLARREKDQANNIEAALKNHGLCGFVMPPLPQQVDLGEPFIFFNRAEVRVRLIETTAINLKLHPEGPDVYDLADDVMMALHHTPFADVLSHPLMIAAKPCEMVEDPIRRVMDVIFTAVYALEATIH